MLESLLVIKILVAIGVVVGLSIVTERVSPKAAGILAGLPTGSVISLFFIGLDNGETFAANTAVYNVVGIIAMQTLLFVYYLASLKIRHHNMLFSSALSVASYFAAVFILHLFSFDLWLAILLPLASIFVFTHLFRGIKNTKIERQIKPGFGVLVLRAIVAATIILVVIQASSLVGSKWAGLLTAFPTTTFPLILIIHYTYGAKHVHTIIKNFPVGLASLIAYSLFVSMAYPAIGIYYGTIGGLAVALIACILIYLLHANKLGKKK